MGKREPLYENSPVIKMLSKEVLAIHKLLHMEMTYNSKSHEIMDVMRSRLQKKRIVVWRKSHAQMLSSASNMVKSTVRNIRSRSKSSNGLKDDKKIINVINPMHQTQQQVKTKKKKRRKC